MLTPFPGRGQGGGHPAYGADARRFVGHAHEHESRKKGRIGPDEVPRETAVETAIRWCALYWADGDEERAHRYADKAFVLAAQGTTLPR